MNKCLYLGKIDMFLRFEGFAWRVVIYWRGTCPL